MQVVSCTDRMYQKYSTNNFVILLLFLDVPTHLYMRLCRSLCVCHALVKTAKNQRICKKIIALRMIGPQIKVKNRSLTHAINQLYTRTHR